MCRRKVPAVPPPMSTAWGRSFTRSPWARTGSIFPELSTSLDQHPEKPRLLALNPVLLKACSDNPAGRYRSASDLCADLSALERGRTLRRRVPWSLLLLAPLACAGALAWWFLRSAPHGEAISDLNIATEPAGAMVLLGDRMERSPAKFESVETGTYPLQIMLSGYDPIKTRIDTSAPPATFRLQRSKGTLDISVEGPGSADYEVLFANKLVAHGHIPGSLTNLPTGSYEVIVHRAGRTVHQTVDVGREQPASVTLAFSTGRVSVSSDPVGAEIIVDGTSLGQAPITLELPTGPHDFTARYRNWPEARQSLTIGRNTNSPLEFAFRNGSVKITSAPGGASVLRGGVELGRTPLLIDEVEPGPVQYELQMAGYKNAILTGTVAPRGQVFLAARLEMKRTPEPGQPWTNSLGMKFVPMGNIYIAVWDTRVADYDAYCTATGRACRKPDFQQTPIDPVVLVSWTDAEAFCKWLTQKETQEGTLEEGQAYRLPTDAEWSAADGMPSEAGATPEERDGKLRGSYPWGNAWPPPAGSGNFADKTAGRRSGKIIEGYTDGFQATSPTASFPPNRLGLYDMSGNVWQWVEDGYRGGGDGHDWAVLRGGSWGTSSRSELESCYRNVVDRNDRDVIYGFRCVLATGTAQ